MCVNKEVKMILSDIDDTFTSGNESTPSVNVRAFRLAGKKKKKTGLLTGRQVLTAIDHAKHCRVHYLGTENGGVLFEWKNKRYDIVHCVPIDFKLCCHMVAKVEELRQQGIFVVYHLSSTTKFLVRKGCLEEYWPIFYPQDKLRHKKSEVVRFGSDFAFEMQQRGLHKELIKVCVDFGRENLIIAGQFAVFLTELGINFWETAPGKFEICGETAGKVHCIKKILQIEQKRGNIIHPREVVFFGDRWNDKDALIYCRGFIVQNAPEELKVELKDSVQQIGHNNKGSVGATVLTLIRGHI